MAGDVRVLWATPRSASTAFERMAIERGDHTVLTEPFSLAYYYGPDAVSDRYGRADRPGCSYPEVLDRVEQAERPLFFKDMPHHLGPLLGPDVLARWHSTFLIRDPAWTLPSMARIWPDVTDDELGFEAQRRAFDLCRELTGEIPLVIDSADLRREPEAVIRAWCDEVGVEFLPEALIWEPGMPEQWLEWEEWFSSTAKTSGFVPPQPRPEPEVTPEQAERIAVAREHYDVLKAHRLEV